MIKLRRWSLRSNPIHISPLIQNRKYSRNILTWNFLIPVNSLLTQRFPRPNDLLLEFRINVSHLIMLAHSPPGRNLRSDWRALCRVTPSSYLDKRSVTRINYKYDYISFLYFFFFFLPFRIIYYDIVLC